MQTPRGTCPKCNGTKRIACPPEIRNPRVLYGYNPINETVPCDNCGGQYMHGYPCGEVRIRPDGTPCLHDYHGSHKPRDCLHIYICAHCGDTYDIDSGD